MTMMGRGVMQVLLAAATAAARGRQGRMDTHILLNKALEIAPAGQGLRMPEHIARPIRSRLRRVPDVVDDSDNNTISDELRSDEAHIDEGLREAAWRAGLQVRRPPVDGVSWNASVVAALQQAMNEANTVSAEYVAAPHLLAGLLATSAAATGALLAAGIDPATTLTTVREDPSFRLNGEPFAPMVAFLEPFGSIDVTEPAFIRPLQWIMRRDVRRKAGTSPIILTVKVEATRQAILDRATAVTGLHLLKAIVSFDHQLGITGKKLARRSIAYNAAAQVLDRFNIDLEQTRPATDTQTGEAQTRRANSRSWSLTPVDLQPEALAACERSAVMAIERGDAEAGTSHLLLAMLEDDAGFRDLLAALDIDATSIRAAVLDDLSSAAR